MGFLNLFSRKQNDQFNACEEDVVFEHILRTFFNFKDKYADKIVALHIFPSKKVEGYVAFDISFIFDGNINWYKSEETSEMLEFFDLVEDNAGFMTYECVHNTFEQSSNYTYIHMKLKACVRNFMNSNPNIQFDLSGVGAVIKYW